MKDLLTRSEKETLDYFFEMVRIGNFEIQPYLLVKNGYVIHFAGMADYGWNFLYYPDIGMHYECRRQEHTTYLSTQGGHSHSHNMTNNNPNNNGAHSHSLGTTKHCISYENLLKYEELKILEDAVMIIDLK